MKKFLSLVLAVIMTMSLVTISAGATEYRDLTDKDEIQYEEAVAVLNRLGIITGYDDGSFRPDDELTRGAAAKIIVSLLIGPDAASGLTAPTAPYPDVPTTHTFAGVISFCKTSEIISGYGDGTFKPGNPLTGFAFAKMLLGALGYNSKIERFVDTGWTQNVAKVGNVAGLFDRLDFDGAGAVNRETACQLALNTLKATMVTYGGTTVVTGANQQSYMVQGTQAMYVTSNNREINANINRRVINATNNEMTLEFGEEHFKDLRLEHDKYDPAYDIYGHPSNEWSYKKVTIGTFALEPDFKYTTQISHIEDTVATKEKALGLRGYDTYSTDHRANYTNWSSAAGGQYQYNSPFNDATQIHINGWNARVRNDDYPQGSYPANVDRDGQVYTYDASRIGASNKEEAPSLSEIADLTDNGVTVEVYVCPVDADFITDVVVTRTQLMKVDRITSDAIYMETITPDSTDVVRDAETLDEIAGYNDNALNKEVISVKDDNYDAYNALKDMKAGDRMAIIPYTADDGKTWEVGEAYQPETVSGVLTNVDIYNTSRKPDGNAVAITVGGTTYPIAQWNKDMIDVSGPQIKATRKDVTLYLDKLGNAMWADEIGNSDAWMIVGDYYQATGVSSRVDWFVHGWTISGEEIDLDLGTIRGEAEKYAPGELVRYAISDGGNGEYTLTKPNYNGEYVLKQDYNKAHYDANTMFRNGRSSEQPLLKDGESTGEGIYTVAQYAYQTGTNNPVQYNIKKGNDYIPLDRYNTQENSAILPTTASGLRLDYSAVTSQSGISYNTATDAVTAPATFAADWTYKIAPYDGVKFIFVGFDSSTGEVDTIDVVDGPVNVDYSDLIQINRYWRNVGTNVDNWVASPAEAYVNDKGLVKAVVIKNDAAEPSMSDYYIITDNKGSDTVVKSTGADAPTSGTYYTRQYVCGADGFKEEKTGYFDKALEVGTIITGRLGSDGVIKSRVFHANEYTNKNPDALYIKGIGRVMTLNNKVSESSFVVGSSTGNIVATVGTGRGYGHTLDVNTCDILGDEIVMGDTAVSNHSGLIKVDSATQFIDLRPGRPGDIKDLGDLLDYKNDSNVILKVLLNGNKSSDGFRRAYAVVILNATTAGANDVVIGSGSLMPVTDNNSGFLYATRNGIRYNTIAGLQRDLQVGDIVKIHVKPGFSIEVDKAGDPSYSSDADGNIATLTIPGDSSVPVVISKISDTTNPETVTVTISGNTDNVTVTFTNAANAADVKQGTTTVTLTKGTTYNVSISSADAANGYDVNPKTITAGTNDSVTVTKNPTGDVTITPIGVAGQTMTFKNSTTNETIKTATVGTPVDLPTGVMMYVEADTNGYYACASRGGKPYGRNFLAENLDSVEVYLAGELKTTFVLASDGKTLSIKDIPAEANAKAASSEVEVEAATSIQNAPAGTGYWKISFEGGYILCEEGTGFDAGLLLIRGDTPQDYLDALLNVLVNDGELSTPEPISSVEYEDGYVPQDPGEDPTKPIESLVTLANDSTGLITLDPSSKISVWQDGNIDLDLKFQAPDWAAPTGGTTAVDTEADINEAAGDLTFVAMLSKNGDGYNAKSFSSDSSKTAGDAGAFVGFTAATNTAPTCDFENIGDRTDITTPNDETNGWGWFVDPKDHNVNMKTDSWTVQIQGVKWKFAGVRYQYADGTAIKPAALVTTSNESLQIGLASNLLFKFDVTQDPDYEITGPLTYTIEGLDSVGNPTGAGTTAGSTGNTGTITGNNTQVTIANAVAGNRWVTVTIGGVTKKAPSELKLVDWAEGTGTILMLDKTAKGISAITGDGRGDTTTLNISAWFATDVGTTKIGSETGSDDADGIFTATGGKLTVAIDPNTGKAALPYALKVELGAAGINAADAYDVTIRIRNEAGTLISEFHKFMVPTAGTGESVLWNEAVCTGTSMDGIFMTENLYINEEDVIVTPISAPSIVKYEYDGNDTQGFVTLTFDKPFDISKYPSPARFVKGDAGTTATANLTTCKVTWAEWIDAQTMRVTINNFDAKTTTKDSQPTFTISSDNGDQLIGASGAPLPTITVRTYVALADTPVYQGDLYDVVINP